MGKMNEQLELFDDVSFDTLIQKTLEWADDKQLLLYVNAPKQMLKVLEEVGETAGALLKDNQPELKDGIGDSFVTLIILAGQLGYTPTECLLAAYNEIKGRTGKLEGGVFVKDE